MKPIARNAAIAALVASLGAAGVVAAQDPAAPPPPPPPGPPMMESGSPMLMMGRMIGRDGIDFVAIDTDKNGSLSRAELVAFATARLSKTDANGDGILTRAEIVESLPGPHGGIANLFARDPAEDFADRMLATLGATEAGQVPVADLANQRVNFLLAFVDTDRDAAISQAEADAARAAPPRGGPRHGMGPRHGPDGGHGPAGDRGPGGPGGDWGAPGDDEGPDRG